MAQVRLRPFSCAYGVGQDAEMEKRLAGAWRPYHRELSQMVGRSPPNTLVFSIHTFTGTFNPGKVWSGWGGTGASGSHAGWRKGIYLSFSFIDPHAPVHRPRVRAVGAAAVRDSLDSLWTQKSPSSI